jgi:hypothetical protein
MNLVKWLRKNRTKIMAVVVVVLMVAFIGGSALRYMLSPHRSSSSRAIAYFGNNKKITNPELSIARQELEILQLLGADDLLRAQDLRGLFMAELLFSESRPSPALINKLKQVIRSNRIDISDKQINDIYKRAVPSNIYWFLLNNEAQLSGMRVASSEVGELLGRAIPQLFNGQTYTQRMKMLMEKYGIPEDQLLETFGKLLAVLQYAHLICSNEDVTVSQIKWLASCEKETIDAELVKFDSAVFIGDKEQPGEEQILEQFNKYKDIFAGRISEENPYGFGYKLPDRVQLEYVAVKLDDVSPTVALPVPAETEDYYRKNTSQFTESVPEDPNDPNSPLAERVRSYAEMESLISKQLMQDKINSKAEGILQEARVLTDASMQDIDTKSLNPEELKSLMAKAGDYRAIADKLMEKYKIKVYTGQTGLLSGADMETDEYMRRFYMLGQGRNPVRLRQIVFSVEELQESPDTGPGPLDGQRPKLFENIGPVRDFMGKMVLLVRVTSAEKASAPKSIDSVLDTKSLMFDDGRESGIEHPGSRTVRENITNDLKKLAVIRDGLLKSKAEEFIATAAKDGWDKTINKFNGLYGHAATNADANEVKQNEKDPNVFEVEQLTNLRRITKETLEALKAQSGGGMGEQLFVREAQKWLTINGAEIQRRFIDKLYSLVPQNSSTANNLPILMEFQPEMSFYVIKNILVKRLSLEDYEKNRTQLFFKEDESQSQSMAPVYFNPENILKRMNFRLASQENQTKAESEDKG